jgi:general secretion pathway protein D
MSFFNRLMAVVLAATLAAPVMPLEARTRKGDKFFGEGRIHEGKKEWDAALDSYEKALSEDPADIAYQIAVDRSRFQASQVHLDAGLKIRAGGQLGEALIEFQKAFAISPASVIAVQEIQETQDMIARERRRVEATGREAAPEVRALSPADTQRKKEDDAINRMLPVPELRPLKSGLVDLKITGRTKVVYETLGQYAGINVIWDPDYQNPGKDNVSVNFDHSTIEQALDYVDVVTHSFHKAMSPNTIFITNDNPNKRRDYEEQVLKTIYLQNVVSQQEFQEVANAVRTVPELTRVFPDLAQYAIVVRGEADRVAMAEKIVHDLDKPRAEVLVDIIVMQASTSFNQQITTAIASTGLNVAINSTPRAAIQVQGGSNNSSTSSSSSTTGTSTSTGTTVSTSTNSSTTSGAAIPLSNLGRLATSDFATTLPSALLQAAMSDTKSKVLQSPELRAVDNSKAILKIGQRQPIASGSFQPGVGGVGINPLVNTQFTFQDVGVNVELLARIHPNNEVTMHIHLEISAVDSYQNLGGVQQPVIGQRTVDHDLRMREGEVGFIGGIMQQQDDTTVTGIPGLSSIPLFGYLFKGHSMDHTRNDLVIAIVPHVIRKPDFDASNLKTIGVGNQSSVKISYGPRADEGDGSAATPAQPATPAVPPEQRAGAAAPVTQPVAGPPATQPVAGPPATAPPATAPPLMPPATAPPLGPGGIPAQPVPPPPAGNAALRFGPGPVQTNAGSTFTVSLLLDNPSGITSAPVQIVFDPKALRLNDVSNGGMLPLLTKQLQNDAGLANIQLSVPPGATGASSSGALLNLSFTAIAPGSYSVTAPNLSLRNAQGQTVASGSPSISVTVK